MTAIDTHGQRQRIGPIAEHLHELVRAEIQRPGVVRYELHVDGGVVTHTAVAVAA